MFFEMNCFEGWAFRMKLCGFEGKTAKLFRIVLFAFG